MRICMPISHCEFVTVFFLLRIHPCQKNNKFGKPGGGKYMLTHGEIKRRIKRKQREGKRKAKKTQSTKKHDYKSKKIKWSRLYKAPTYNTRMIRP